MCFREQLDENTCGNLIEISKVLLEIHGNKVSRAGNALGSALAPPHERPRRVPGAPQSAETL